MDKIINPILVLIIGVLLILQTGGWISALASYYGWIIAILVLAIGVLKLMKTD